MHGSCACADLRRTTATYSCTEDRSSRSASGYTALLKRVYEEFRFNGKIIYKVARRTRESIGLGTRLFGTGEYAADGDARGMSGWSSDGAGRGEPLWHEIRIHVAGTARGRFSGAKRHECRIVLPMPGRPAPKSWPGKLAAGAGDAFIARSSVFRMERFIRHCLSEHSAARCPLACFAAGAGLASNIQSGSWPLIRDQLP